jgi:hypothetical protein
MASVCASAYQITLSTQTSSHYNKYMHTDWLHFQQDAAPIRLRSFPTPIKMQERFLRSCTSAESPLLHPHSIDLSGHAVGLTMYLAFRWCRKAWRDSREILKSTWLLIAFESFALPYQVSACHGAAQPHQPPGQLHSLLLSHIPSSRPLDYTLT